MGEEDDTVSFNGFIDGIVFPIVPGIRGGARLGILFRNDAEVDDNVVGNGSPSCFVGLGLFRC